MTWPTITFTGKMTLWLGKLEVQLLQLGRGHTKGDTVVWLPQQTASCSRGDLVEFDATPYAGDAYFKDWPQTLDNLAALKPRALVPGRGAGADHAASRWPPGLAGTRGFIADVCASVKAGVRGRQGPERGLQGHLAKLKPKYGHWVIFDHCMPFDVTRCYDEATQYRRPAHLDRRARPSRCGRRSKAERHDAPAAEPLQLEPRCDYPAARLRLPARCADQDARDAGAPPGGGGRRRAGRPGAGHRPRAAQVPVRAARQRPHAVDRLARDLLCQAHAGDLRSARLRRAHGRQGRVAGTSARSSSRDEQVYSFDLLPEAGHERPAFINLQQYYVEGYLAERARELPLIDLRWKNKVAGVDAGRATRVHAAGRDARRAATRSQADYVAACDGARSSVRAAARPGEQGPHLPRPLPDRRREDGACRLPGRALVLVRPAVPPATRACCCTGSPTASGASTSSSAGTPTPRKRRSPRTSSRA